jgi:hypothetical protein
MQAASTSKPSRQRAARTARPRTAARQQQRKTQRKQRVNPIWQTVKDVVPLGANVIGEMALPGSGKILGTLSSRAMDYFGKITGWGDYFVNRNSIMAGEAPRAKFGPSNNRIRDTEWVKVLKVPASPQFKLHSRYFICPSNPKLFPKLSVRARQFQKWKLHGMVVHLDTVCSKSITTPPNGNMSLPNALVLTAYNLTEREPQNMSQVLNSFFGNARPVNEDLVHPIECDPSQRATDILYCWPDEAYPGAVRDPKLENAGVINIFFQGGQQTAEFDALYLRIEYDIEFLQPIVRTQLEVADHWERTALASTFEVEAALQSTSSSYGDPQTVYTVSGDVITFDDSVYGNYSFEGYIQYTVGNALAEALPNLGGNCTPLNVQFGDSTSVFNTQGAALTAHHYRVTFSVTGGGTLTLGKANATNYVREDYYLQSLKTLTN